MNAFQRSAVFAAVLVLLAIHAEAQTAPVATRATCTVVTPTATTAQYNNFTQLCCPNGGPKTLSTSVDPYLDCCHDNVNAGCPPVAGLNSTDQISCCRPEPARIANDAPFSAAPRNCYSPQFQGCCRAQYQDTARIVGSAQTFDFETQQCCAVGTSQPLWGGQSNTDNVADKVIVPKSVSSCVNYLRKVGTTFRCLTDSMCPGYRTTGENRGKCCRRPLAFGETAADYDKFGAGQCYDPKLEGCCNAWVGSAGFSQTVQASSSTVYELKTKQCCKLPIDTNKYITDINDKCPCLGDTDCPTGNYTCCAPTQTQLQGGIAGSRRLVQCTGAAGAPTDDLLATNFPGSQFPGCYGKCLPSGTTSGTGYTSSLVCLNSLPNFVDQCKDLRTEDKNAFDFGFPQALKIGGIQWVTPSVDSLYAAEAVWHGKDCCKNENGYSVLYSPTDSTCCPVMGTSPAGGDFPRRLTPVVPRAVAGKPADSYVGTDDPVNWAGCLCAADADCQAGYKCCENGNSWIVDRYTDGGSNLKANQLLYTRADGTVLNGICINANTTECCKLDRSNPATVSVAGSFALVARPYDPTKMVCCATSGLSMTGECSCHTNADCPGEFGACCTASNQFGSGTHAAGKCYDSRTMKCCQYHTADGDLEPLNTPALAFAKVYDDSAKVCCPWGGLQDTIVGCRCRSDKADSDCGTNLKCCSTMAPSLGSSTTQYRTSGRCYDPNLSQGCCQYRTTIVPPSALAAIYDTQREVCCAVNGKQSDHRACRCSNDAHCPANGECCVDAEAKAAGARIDCSDFTTPGACPGRCIHKEIESCCDKPFTSEWKVDTPVSTCVNNYQKCCNGECCNKATQTCKTTTKNRASLSGSNVLQSRIGAVTTGGDTNFIAGYHYGLDEDAKACTTLEHSSPSIVFHTWVFPAFLSVASIIVVLLGSRAGLTADVGSNMHRMVLVGVQVFVAIMSILLLWSPLWKYGFGIIFANSFILHSFVVGGQWTRRIACILIVVTFLWVYEPFGTNVILSFGTVTFRGSGNDAQGQPNHGLNYAARQLQRARTDVTGIDACTEFYMYWRTDDKLHDARTWNPQGATHGICRRSWMHTIVVLAGIIMPFEAVWLFLAAVAMARASQATKDVKVQPIQA